MERRGFWRAPSSLQPLREAEFLNVNLTVSFGKVIVITWPIPAEINDAKLEKQLFTPLGFYEIRSGTVPDSGKARAELKRRGSRCASHASARGFRASGE